MEAAANGHADVISTLLAHGADANFVNFYGATAVDLASQHPDVFSTLKANGAVVDSQQLLEAAEEGDAELLLTLIDNGEDINSDINGETPLSLAVKNGHANVVSTLLDHGAESEIYNSFLNEAAINGHADIAADLLAHGADVNVKYFGQYSALTDAAKNGHADVVDILLSNGADINHQERDGEIALVFAAISGHADVVSLLIKHGADMSIRTRSGDTALLMAAERGHTDVASALLASGADAADVDVFSGQTALLLAARNGNDVEMLSILVDHEADINKKTSKPEFSFDLTITPGETALDIVMGRPNCTGNKKTDNYLPGICITEGDKQTIITFLGEHGARRSSHL